MDSPSEQFPAKVLVRSLALGEAAVRGLRVSPPSWQQGLAGATASAAELGAAPKAEESNTAVSLTEHS